MSKTSETTPLLKGGSKGAQSQPSAAASIDSNDQLAKFRKAIGINIDASGDDVEIARGGARGIYKEVIQQQRTRSRQYIFVDILFYFSFFTQIVIGATLAALGPLSKLHPTAITVLGVTNTTIAGVLALLKGQGLPDRLRKDEYEMQKVQDFIEETEARLVVAGTSLTVQEVDDAVQKVFVKYNAARDTQEANRPDSYGHQPEEAMHPRNLIGGSGVVDGTQLDGNAGGKGTENGNGKGKGKEADT
jgi:hypothetical protein